METRERIKEKADELYRRYGVKSVTMDEIALQMGVSKKTIYQSFSDKNELVDEVVVDMLEANKISCLQSIAKSKNAIHEVMLIMDAMEDMMASLSPSFIFDIERGYSNTFKKFDQYKSDFINNTIITNIERGKSEGLYRPELNTEIVAKFRLNTIMFPYNEDIFPRNQFTVLELQNEMIIYHLYGLVTLKGYQLITKYQNESSKNTEQ
ncbi:MAG: TetR/AcrR family transcriptional regulator [Ginsengibacter sp.]